MAAGTGVDFGELRHRISRMAVAIVAVGALLATSGFVLPLVFPNAPFFAQQFLWLLAAASGLAAAVAAGLTLLPPGPRDLDEQLHMERVDDDDNRPYPLDRPQAQSYLRARRRVLVAAGYLLFAIVSSAAATAVTVGRQHGDASADSGGPHDANSVPGPVMFRDPEDAPQPRPRCGVDRWPVKTLSDSEAAKVDMTPVPATIAQLTTAPAPEKLPRTQGRIGPREFRRYRLSHVRLEEVKRMPNSADRDLHLVVADAADREMVVELPDVDCAGPATSRYREQMARARASFEADCFPSSIRPPTSFVELTGTATLDGILFYDSRHGQRGVSANGVELHPVLAFHSTNCRRAN